MEEVVQESKPRFSFGKYKGMTWDEVAKINPNYIHWCIRNVAWFTIPPGCVIPLYQRKVWFYDDGDDDYWDDPYHDGWGGEWDW